MMKPGISGQKLNKNGTSPRANRQLSELNKNQKGRYKAVIVKNNVQRVKAKSIEQKITDKHGARNNGNQPSEIHKRPKSQVKTREEYIAFYGESDNR